MKIIIFGASGITGQLLVQEALRHHYFVYAFVRNTQAFVVRHSNLAVLTGDVFNLQEVDNAIKNSDIILSAIGNRTIPAFFKQSKPLSYGTINIVNSMNKYGIKRLIYLTSFAVSDQIFLPERWLIRTVLRNIFYDLPIQEKTITTTNLQWTIIRPARLINDTTSHTLHIGTHVSISPFSSISRSDVAQFMIKIITDTNYFQKTITISR